MPFIIRDTITQTFLERSQATPKAVGFRFKRDGNWVPVTFREFFEQCRQTSHGLMSLGLEEGDRITLLSNTRYEWPLLDMAVLGARAITVPIYPTSTGEDCAYILENSESSIAIFENPQQLQKLASYAGRLSHVRKWVLIDSQGRSELPDWIREKTIAMPELLERGKKEEALFPLRFERNLEKAMPDDLITLAYTSGTTGVPKGVMLSHRNLMSVIRDVLEALSGEIEPEGEKLLAFLPFSHIIGKVESMAAYATGYCECYAESLEKIVDNLVEVKPTIVFAVPRIFEKAYSRILAEVDSASEIQRKTFYWAMKAGEEYLQASVAQRMINPKLYAQYRVARRVVFKKVLDRFGGNIRFIISGGAPLPQKIAKDFLVLGLPILEGYGLTETCAPVSLNTPRNFKIGSVGKPLADVSVKRAEDGEILIQSEKVFQGYYRDPQGTEAALEGGWLHTGDIGHLDDEGYLWITDRKKDLLITSGGKNVAPLKIENLAKSHKFIHQFFVYGDGRNYLTALVTLEKDLILQYAEDQKILYSEYAELMKHARIRSMVQRIVDEINLQLASFETIKKFMILPEPFSIEKGELTPSLKLRRGPIEANYRGQLESLYESTT